MTPTNESRAPRVTSLLPLVSATLFAAIACAPPAGGPSDAIVIGTTRDLETINELISANSSFNSDIVHRLFLNLLEEQPDYQDHPPTFAPRLAESYEFSEDRLQLTFELRSDVLWSDGVPVTAEDVRWTWQAQTHPDVSWDYAWVKERIDDVEVVGPHTVRFHFSEVYAAQLLDANEGVILPRHVWSRLPFEEWRTNTGWFLDNAVFDGPFVLADWQRQQQIVLRRNELYYEEGLPRTERVVFRIVQDQSQLVAQLLQGSLDVIRSVEATDAERISATEHTRLWRFPSKQYTFLGWNLLRPQFSDPEVRRALAMATDRQAIVDVVWKGYARIGTSPIVADVWAFNRDLEPWPHDPEAAIEILERHGWTDEDGDGTRDKEGIPFSFELVTNPGNRAREDASLMLQEQLGRVGIDVRLRRLELDTLIRKAMTHDFDAILSAFSIDTSLDLSYTFHSSQIEAGTNWSSYSSPEVDRLIEEIADQSDIMDAKEQFDRIQEILHWEQPFLYLWEPEGLVATNVRIENLAPNALSDFANLREWSVRNP